GNSPRDVGGGASLGRRTAAQQGKQGPIAAVGWPTVSTVDEMSLDRRGLFRAKLLIQIFPETTPDLRTLHQRTSSPGARRRTAAWYAGEQGSPRPGSAPVRPPTWRVPS